MKNIRYYVSRKNPLTWLAAAMAIGSAVMRILASCFGLQLSGINFWFQKVLPIWVALGFAFILLVRGPKEYYRSTKPVFWACVYFGQIALDWNIVLRSQPGLISKLGVYYALFGYMRYVVACWILYLVFYVVYRMFMTGKIKHMFVLPILTLIPFAVMLYDFVYAVQEIQIYDLMNKLANSK